MRLAAVAALAVAAAACKKAEVQPMVEISPPPARGTTAWKIYSARTGAPAEITANATIMDEMVRDTGITTRLVEGDNGWTCYPDDPSTDANDPWCVDEEGKKFLDAWQNHVRPRLAGMGIAYMMQGGVVASDTDPYQLAPDSGKAWIVNGPGIAIVMPTPRSYAGLPTTRRADGPWVRFAGTPYAHIVIPAGH
jgi:hypothetical protein